MEQHPIRDIGHGRTLASPARFAADDGSPDEAIRRARTRDDLVAALRSGRVLVAVTAISGEIDENGADKSSDMAVVSMVTADGRRGLLAFSGLDALAAWDPRARPVPVAGAHAAAAALDDGCEALVIDVAGPRQQVVIETDLVTVAGRDLGEYLCEVAQVDADKHFGAGQVTVQFDGHNLRLECSALIAEDVAQHVRHQPRIAALVPGRLEVHPL